ncbi:MAG: recombinase family protein [Rhodospirillaceae bacterium]|nr:recombinase family protein [Rhodospirillaceae bacterium]
MASEKKKLVCAIYTRKSSEEGLEQEFNSLDAQREACEAYIRSQKHEGWVVLDAAYDDGGFSGGNMERPGLVRLLVDIRAQKIDIVVVYKVDRLTRALSDFAKIVETFDGHGVSFVSVTQQFNTTTSMGRLTLNVLLSFAQFEREVTGERIRDKIAASKKKGMWMGGNIPLGYRLEDRKLVPDEIEADMVREIFRIYCELKCVRKMKAVIEAKGIRTKAWVSSSGKKHGGLGFSRGNLYYVLKNRIYLGEIVHKGNAYAGQHEAIVSEELWNRTHGLLEKNRIDRKNGKGFRSYSPLAGIIFDDRGNRLTATHAGSGLEKRRYYVSQAVLQHDSSKIGSIKRVPAPEIEGVVERQLAALFAQPQQIAVELYGSASSPEILRQITESLSEFRESESGAKLLHTKLRSVLKRVTVGVDVVQIEIGREALVLSLNLPKLPSSQADQTFEIKVAVRVKKGGRPGKILISELALGRSVPVINPSLVKAVVRGHIWDEQLRSGLSISEISLKENVNRTYVGQVVQLAHLAPDITEAILDGRQPEGFKVEELLKPLPATWADQRKQLGFAV